MIVASRAADATSSLRELPATESGVTLVVLGDALPADWQRLAVAATTRQVGDRSIGAVHLVSGGAERVWGAIAVANVNPEAADAEAVMCAPLLVGGAEVLGVPDGERTPSAAAVFLLSVAEACRHEGCACIADAACAHLIDNDAVDQVSLGSLRALLRGSASQTPVATREALVGGVDGAIAAPAALSAVRRLAVLSSSDARLAYAALLRPGVQVGDAVFGAGGPAALVVETREAALPRVERTLLRDEQNRGAEAPALGSQGGVVYLGASPAFALVTASPALANQFDMRHAPRLDLSKPAAAVATLTAALDVTGGVFVGPMLSETQRMVLPIDEAGRANESTCCIVDEAGLCMALQTDFFYDERVFFKLSCHAVKADAGVPSPDPLQPARVWRLGGTCTSRERVAICSNDWLCGARVRCRVCPSQ